MSKWWIKLLESFLSGLNNPNGLAIDWISKNIFISTNEEEARIVACNLKGEFFSVIFSNEQPVLGMKVNITAYCKSIDFGRFDRFKFVDYSNPTLF